MFLVKNKQQQKETLITDEKELFDKRRKFNKDFLKTIGLTNKENSINYPRSKTKKTKVENIYYNRPQTTRNVSNTNQLLKKSSSSNTPNKKLFYANSKTESSNPNIITSKNTTTNANTINKSIEKSSHIMKKLYQLKKYDNFINEEEEKKFNTQREYYQLDNGKKSAKYRKSLLNIADCVCAYNDEKLILHKIKKFTKDYSCSQVKLIETQKIKRFAELQTIPTTVCFGRCLPRKNNFEDNYIEINNTNLIHKRIKNKSTNPSKKNHRNYMNIFKNGFNENDNRFIINTEKNKINETKDMFGNIVYPIYNSKKILKNILPKEIDYNTQRTVAEIIENEKHPMKRNLKKLFNTHMNVLNQQIEQAISDQIHLIKRPKNEKIDLDTQEKFIILMKNNIIDKDKGRKNSSYIKQLTNQQNYLRKKYLFKKLMNTVFEISVKFKRLGITLNYFNYIYELNQSKIPEKDGQYLFQAIKAEDIEEVSKLLEKEEYNIVMYKDQFLQTPLHICAKRNIYQLVEKFCFRLININSQDESGRTPLMLAAQAGHVEFVCILLYKMADPRIKDKMGKSAEELTDNEIIKKFLGRAKAIYIFFSCINVWCFDKFLRRGLELLFCKEVGFKFHSWDDLEFKLNIKLK